jgi:hypothetical protein
VSLRCSFEFFFSLRSRRVEKEKGKKVKNFQILTVAHDTVGVVVDDLGVGLVEARREVGLGRGEADGVADALAERA